jgi:polyisoprenoid-binding protein YceI
MKSLFNFYRAGAVAVSLLAAALPIRAAHADTWVFDKQNTEIRFSWDYLGLSRRSARFLDMDGSLNFSPTEPEAGQVDVTIRVASISTGAKEIDDALKSPDFFSATANPRITFKSTGITKTGERTGDIQGELTILGQTRPVVLATTWNFTGEHPLSASNIMFQGKWVSGFTASANVLRSDFGLKRGIPLLSDEIRIDIDAVFLRKD